MFCPKCKENFEEGSRRFCPTDGTRLHSELIEPTVQQGIFSDLVPRVTADAPLEIAASPASNAAPTVTVDHDDEIELELDDQDGMFFEFDDLPAAVETESEFLKPASIRPMPIEPLSRKIDPKQIPSGHIEIDTAAPAPFLPMDIDVDDPESFVGRIVKGRYKIRQYLGGDESGLAYLGEDQIVLDKLVLVRVLLEENEDEILESILTEERVSLSHFSHPNIARLIDSGQFTNGTKYLISEYFDALSVRDVIGIHGQLGEARAIRIVRQVANALNAAHQQGILHRDLRPENIIVSPGADGNEQIRLVNFGASSGEPTLRNVAYKAPEVLAGKITTSASDNFSLAVVAFEMITGNLPFSGETPREVIRSQNNGVSGGLAASLAQVFKKGLALNSAERFHKARDFGDALGTAVHKTPARPDTGNETASVAAGLPQGTPAADTPRTTAKSEQILSVPATDPLSTVRRDGEPAWKNRSPEPPAFGVSARRNRIGIAALLILGIVLIGWLLYSSRTPAPDASIGAGQPPPVNIPPGNGPVNTDIDVPPAPRHITAPPNSVFFQNARESLKGDLYRNFVGFSLYYPKDWKVIGPKEGDDADSGTRGKFLDISKLTDGGLLQEQMLISYYPSRGTFRDDAIRFSEMVKETNETLKMILPGYQMVSEGETKVNGAWRAYEVRFQGGGTSAKGEKLDVWGRRLFIPAARPGVRDGFSITMLATSNSEDIRSVDDVGVKGELGRILETFEPSQNF